MIQSLFAVGMGLQGTALMSGDEELATRIEGAVAELDRVIRDLRNYIFGLRPGILADRQLDQGAAPARRGVRRRRSASSRPSSRSTRRSRPSSPRRAHDVVQVTREALSNVGPARRGHHLPRHASHAGRTKRDARDRRRRHGLRSGDGTARRRPARTSSSAPRRSGGKASIDSPSGRRARRFASRSPCSATPSAERYCTTSAVTIPNIPSRSLHVRKDVAVERPHARVDGVDEDVEPLSGGDHQRVGHVRVPVERESVLRRRPRSGSRGGASGGSCAPSFARWIEDGVALLRDDRLRRREALPVQHVAGRTVAEEQRATRRRPCSP